MPILNPDQFFNGFIQRGRGVCYTLLALLTQDSRAVSQNASSAVAVSTSMVIDAAIAEAVGAHAFLVHGSFIGQYRYLCHFSPSRHCSVINLFRASLALFCGVVVDVRQ
jgi:hypothetical protein